jgi:ubiquinone biosynthesis protein
MIGNIIFVIRTFIILICEMCAYMFGRDKYVCTKNITQKLGNINLFYVKLFQSLSTNSQLLDQKQIEYLSNYTDNVPFNDEDIDNSFIKSIIIVGVINPDIAILLPNNPIPIKSGMIALVYEGRMRTGDKRKVIVKIIRKNIREKILDAIDKIEFLSKLIGGFPYIRNTNVKDLIQENRRMMIEQTDFNIEISNLQHMQENMKNIDYITIPRVYQEYTTENSNVIVMDYIEGKKLNELEERDKDEYSMMLAKFGMKCILFDRFYHADLHPGNILFLCDKNGKIGRAHV